MQARPVRLASAVGGLRQADRLRGSLPHSLAVLGWPGGQLNWLGNTQMRSHNCTPADPLRRCSPAGEHSQIMHLYKCAPTDVFTRLARPPRPPPPGRVLRTRSVGEETGAGSCRGGALRQALAAEDSASNATLYLLLRAADRFRETYRRYPGVYDRWAGGQAGGMQRMGLCCPSSRCLFQAGGGGVWEPTTGKQALALCRITDRPHQLPPPAGIVLMHHPPTATLTPHQS